ncbi:rhodanese-like domain-containing protein [uncultured Paludibaculum sp.]|uniref:rhodanese-like domain-containing protein n=1 Tax=uncultured Paludibaculum sp. TaxID=1765020 RepID=UPI002AAC1474|nr:rhodanese-like domain-containing protein [uncultured Paludibaculum sp.]
MIDMRWVPMMVLAGALCASCDSIGAQGTSPDAGLPASIKEVKARIREIAPADLKSWNASGQRPVLIDVREDSEWQAGHAARALHISRWALDERIGAAVPRKTTRMVLYCQGGVRSALAADKLQKMGYTNVFSLAGGFVAYQAAGLPVER